MGRRPVMHSFRDEGDDKMYRAVWVAMGLALLVVWIIGVSDGATRWLTWLNGMLALLSAGMAGLRLPSTPTAGAIRPAVLAVVAGTLWIVGVAAGATRWLAWWDMAFAIGFVFFSAMAAVQLPIVVNRPRRFA